MCVNLVDRVTSFPTSIYFAKIGVDTAENEPLKVWRRFPTTDMRIYMHGMKKTNLRAFGRLSLNGKPKIADADK